MKRKVFNVLFVLAFFVFCCTYLHSADIQLAWDPSPTIGVEGYKVYYGTTPGSYAQNVDVGNVLTYTITDLGPGTYYIAATAYVGGDESGFSNEVNSTIEVEPPANFRIIVATISEDGRVEIRALTPEEFQESLKA